jgi:predicted PurR-regulated permease PerM
MTTQQKTWFWLIGLAVLLAALYFLRPILLPFVAAMGVAYFLDPVCDWLEEKGLSRTMATAAVTAVFFVVVTVVLAAVAPLVYQQVADFVARVPNYATALSEKLRPILELAADRLGNDEVKDLGKSATQYAGTALKWVASAIGNVLGGLGAVANILSLVVITPIISFYLLRDWDRIVEKVDSWLPRAQADVLRGLAQEVDEILAGFARGQATVCLILGVFYGVGLTLVGLDFGFVVGLFTGLVSFIPYFGMLIGFVLGFGIALAQFDSYTPLLLVAAVFGVGQVVEGNFLTPKLVGGRVKLHEVWILFALMAGGTLFGFVGILIAVPVAAVVGVLARFMIGRYLESPLYEHGAPLGAQVAETETGSSSKTDRPGEADGREGDPPQPS